MLRSTSSLVHRRGPVFWFRKAVPVDLIDRLGSSDIRRSLRTCNARVARQRAWTLVLLIEEAFAVLRDAGLSSGARDALNVVLGRVMDDFDRGGRAWAERAKYGMLLETLGAGQPDSAADSQVSAGILAPPVPGPTSLPAPVFTQSPPSVPGAVRPVDMAQLVAQAVRDAQIDPRARRPLSAFVPDYLKEKAREIAPRTVEELGTKIRIFIDAIGDLEVHAYTRDHLLDFRDLLDDMPKDASKHLGTDNIRKAIALNQGRAIVLPAIGPVTVDAKYLSAIRGIFSHLVVRGILKSNPVVSVSSRQTKDDIEDLLDVEKRLPFSREQIEQLKALSVRESRVSADYWFPRVGPYLGLRVGEFAQLNAADFREHHGRLCLDFLHTPDGEVVNAARRAQLRLKSDAAYRICPLPLIVLESELIEYIERRRKEDGPLAPLFPDELPNRHGVHGQNLSKRLGRDIDEISEDPRLVAHSARHFFAACCDEIGMPKHLRNRFMGHEPDENDDDKKKRRGRHVSARYGSPVPSIDEMAWIDLLKF